jgi:predicted deacylase
MRTDIWDRTVVVTLDSGDHFESVQTSRAALACLMTRWPEMRGKSFATARRACMESMSGKVDHSAAAGAFEEAAREAGILR